MNYEKFLMEATNVICHVCGCKLAESENGREAHMKRYHAVIYAKQRKFRPKAVIVDEVERRLSAFLIDGTKKDCPEGCGCIVCFNVGLDRILASQEAENVSGTGAAFDDHMASDQL